MGMTQAPIMLSKFAMKQQLRRTPPGEFRQRLLIAKHNGLDETNRYIVTQKPKPEEPDESDITDAIEIRLKTGF